MAAGTRRTPQLTGAARWRKRKRPGARAGLWEGHGREVARGAPTDLARLGVPALAMPIGREPQIALPERRPDPGSYGNRDAAQRAALRRGVRDIQEAAPENGVQRRTTEEFLISLLFTGVLTGPRTREKSAATPHREGAR